MSSFLPRFFMPSFLSQKSMLNIVYHDFTFSRNFGISNVLFHVAGTIETPTRSHQNGTDPIDYGFDNFVDFFPLFAPPPDGQKREIRKMSSETTSTAENLHICLLTLDGKFMQKMHRNDVTCVAVILLLRQKTTFLKSLLFKIA